MATKNPNAGKPGYDKYGVKLMSQRRKEEQAEKNRKKFIESRNARDKQIRDNAAQKAQVAKIKETMGYSDSTSAKPKSSQPKREKQSVASSITDAKIKKLDTSIKGENIKAKESSSSNEPKKQVGDKERRQLNRAANLAVRKGITLDEASALKEKRRTARKQYLRDFASQLARGEQAAPKVGFGEGEGKPTGSTSLAGIQGENKAKAEQASQDQKDILNSVDTFKVPNSGLGLTGMDMVGQNFGKDLMSQIEVPDLNPVKYMQETYRKKRGY